MCEFTGKMKSLIIPEDKPLTGYKVLVWNPTIRVYISPTGFHGRRNRWFGRKLEAHKSPIQRDNAGIHVFEKQQDAEKWRRLRDHHCFIRDYKLVEVQIWGKAIHYDGIPDPNWWATGSRPGWRVQHARIVRRLK